MEEEAELLRRYADEKSQGAFAELVRRKVNLVYAAALRQTGGDVHLAQDVTQGVFLALARQASTLNRHAVLTGWLYTTTRYLATKAVRTQVRWQRREQEANTMNAILSEPEPAWNELRPVIDAAMHELGEQDRAAVLLRYFEGLPLARVGTALGLNENAARMRVDRAIEKLRGHLAQRGITSTAVALSGALAAQPAVAAPAGLAAAVVTAATAGIAAATAIPMAATAGHAALTFMTTTKVMLGIGGIAAALGLVVYLGTDHSAGASPADPALWREVLKLRAENERLSAEIARAAAESRPAPVVSANVPLTPAPRPVPATPPATSLGSALTTTQKWNMIRNNLRQIRAAADQFRREYGRSPVSIDELVGETKYIRALAAADSENYSSLNLSDSAGPLTLTTASGLTVKLEDIGDLPPPAPFVVAQEKAMAAFRAVNGGRTPTGAELAAYFEAPDFRQEFLLKAKGLAFQQEMGAAMAPEMQKAFTAYKAATGRDAKSWEDVLAVAPYFENPADQARLLEVWHRLDVQFGH